MVVRVSICRVGGGVVTVADLSPLERQERLRMILRASRERDEWVAKKQAMGIRPGSLADLRLEVARKMKAGGKDYGNEQ